MNIAVLIGVSQYKTEAPLPACKIDVEQMQRLLFATKKYDEICTLTEGTNSATLKDALRGFFSKFQGTQGIGEALVYFSGHGIYYSDALLCCSDFDHSRPATTSISNAELDDLLRSVNPDVAVKIIDACQSGSPYIKEAGPGFEKALKASQLRSFICMASSRQDQASYASSEASTFTLKLIDAALYKETGNVLYRDIQAALADAFVGNMEQTPFFVNQGTGLEAFASVTQEMQQLARARSMPIVQTSKDTVGDILADKIALLDSQFVTSDQAFHTIDQAGRDIGHEELTDPVISRFYEKRASHLSKLTTLPGTRKMAEFAEEQGWDKKYFMRLNYREVRVRVPRSPFGAAALTTLGLSEEDYVSKVKKVPYLLESTQPLPFEVLEITFEPKKHPSLKSFVLYKGLVHSLTEVMVLSAVVELLQRGWTERSPDLSDIQWKYQNYPWREVVNKPQLIWEEPLKRGQDTIRTYLEKMVPREKEGDA